ncbi:MAG: NPCBM/NEW2 domain-containing protein [Armatimonadetes bacterium]|nr:NPCBM/NEW2 domain-containing protein [Armatimonadota bacterium]
MVICATCGADQPPATEYLSDRLDLFSYIQQGWGELGIDTAARAPGRTPIPLRIKDKTFAKGLGHHAPGEIVVDLEGLYETFEAEVGVLWQGGNVGSVVFRVFVDDRRRFDSGIMREREAPKPVRVSVAGAQELRLVVTDAGDGITCDCANWAEARLVRSSKTKSRKRAQPFDAAPFARVVTWDPNRVDGCRTNRVEEFRADEVFLETDVLPDKRDCYTVPVAEGSVGCIGLQWYERRLLKEVGLEFAEDEDVLSPDRVQVQAWFGESPWQGNWELLQGKVEAQGKRWVFAIDWQNNPKARDGTEKVRWTFPAATKPFVVSRLTAHTNSRCGTVELRLEMEKPEPGKRGQVELYNGIRTGRSASYTPTRCDWDLSKPLRLKVCYTPPRRWKSDRTVIGLQLPTGAFGVAVEDVLAHGFVYVQKHGLFVVREPSRRDLTDYRRKLASRKTVLQKVRMRSDQTFEQAMAAVHRAVQDNGPTMLSLACDNRKFVVQRAGAIRCESFELIPQFGSGKNERLTRHLEGGWLPAPTNSVTENEVLYRQRTFVLPYDRTQAGAEGGVTTLHPHPLCVAEFNIENSSAEAQVATLRLTFAAEADQHVPAVLRKVGSRFVAQSQDRLLATLDLSGASVFQPQLLEGTLVLTGTIPPQGKARCYVYMPGWEMNPEACGSLAGGEDLLSRMETYWRQTLTPAMQIEIPEPLLQKVILSSQVHCLMAARNEENGERIAPWIASMVYGPLESEAHSIIRGMSFFGHDDFSRRSLNYFIHRYNSAGFLTTGYTLMGTGWHLWTVGEHYQLTRDTDWMESVAPEAARVCQWIARQCEKTRRLDAHGDESPDYGLAPPGVVADWNRFAYRFYMQGNLYAGLHEAATALKKVGHPEANQLLEKADQFREAILRAYRWTRARTPVVRLSNGAWIPNYPSMLYCFGPTGEMFAGEDWGRTWAGDVEIGAHHLAPLGVLDPKSAEVEEIVEHMEDHWFLQSGMGEYPAEESAKDWFNLGGFAKVQPYYGRVTEIYAARDEVKPFIRSYFNAIPSLLNTENLSFWEHFHNMGAWNKTHETGSFLTQTRFMFVMERGNELWLAPFVTSNWLKEGLSVSVRNAPTRFGKVSYRITSHVSQGYIQAIIEPPARTTPREIVIRLRHPGGKRVRSVTVNGIRHKQFDAAKECIHLRPSAGTITVRANY